MDAGADTPMRPSHAPSMSMRFVRLLLIVLIFAVVGPMVWTVHIAIVVGPLIYGLNWPSRIPPFFLVGFDTRGAYAIGVVPAVIAGGLIGIKHVLLGGARWWFALGIGALVGAGLEFLIDRSLHLGGQGQLVGLFAAAAALSTLTCWRIVESW